MPKFTLKVNDELHTVDTPGTMPILWVLRDKLKLTGSKYGCGIGQCGACTIHVEENANARMLRAGPSIGWKIYNHN